MYAWRYCIMRGLPYVFPLSCECLGWCRRARGRKEREEWRHERDACTRTHPPPPQTGREPDGHTRHARQSLSLKAGPAPCTWNNRLSLYCHWELLLRNTLCRGCGVWDACNTHVWVVGTIQSSVRDAQLLRKGIGTYKLPRAGICKFIISLAEQVFP
jgi:hypothetical protein